MIISTLADVEKQLPNQKNLIRGIVYLKDFLKNDKPEVSGRVDIDGENVFAIHSVYDTIPFAPNETLTGEVHRKYIDVQFLVTGRELIGFCPKITAFDDFLQTGADCFNKDVSADVLSFTPLYSECQTLAILFPSDYHLPQLAFDKPEHVRKIVIKAAVE